MSLDYALMGQRQEGNDLLVRCALWMGLLFLVSGCGVSQAQIDEARSLVKEALEVWKQGGKPADLTSRPRPIEFRDPTWSAGQPLVNFELGRSYYDERNKVIRCEASLTLPPARKGKPRTEVAFYDVQLGSPVKISNNPMP